MLLHEILEGNEYNRATGRRMASVRSNRQQERRDDLVLWYTVYGSMVEKIE